MFDTTYVIYRDSNDPSKYQFTQTDFVKFDNSFDIFSCSGKNAYSTTYHGDIKVENNNYIFTQRTVSDSKCGTPDVDYFRLSGDRLEAVKVDAGKIKSGSLSRN